MGFNLKKGCGIGCLVVFTVLVIMMGGATWYSRAINKQYKTVQRTENALLAATDGTPFTPPADLVLAPERLDAFMAVRDSLQDRGRDLAIAAMDFAREKDRQQDGGFRGLLNLISSGSDLAPVYATYWTHRNRTLLTYEMSPAEYTWLYTIIYYKWLDKDPTAGQDARFSTPPPPLEIPGELPQATRDLLAPRRLRLESIFSPQLNPIELIFSHQEN